MRTRYVTSFAVIAALTAACGSTVQTTQSTVGVAPTGVGSTSGATSGDSALSVPSTAAGGTASGSVGGTTATGSGTTATGGTTPTGTGSTSGSPVGAGSTAHNGAAAVEAPGITATTMYFGDFYSQQTAAIDRGIGASGAAPSYDSRDVENSFIKYANEHGGFAGRKLEAIYYNLNLANSRPAEDAAACAQ